MADRVREDGRQVVVLLLAMAGTAACLIFDNSFWESRRDRSLREEAWLSNLSTVATVVVGVRAMYAEERRSG